MSRETVLYGGHSCATLARGIAMANHGEHGDPTNALQAQIEASMAKIAAQQKRLAELSQDVPIHLPEKHPAGAPYVARSDGAFLAGTAQTTLEQTLPNSLQTIPGPSNLGKQTTIDLESIVSTPPPPAGERKTDYPDMHEGFNSGFPTGTPTPKGKAPGSPAPSIAQTFVAEPFGDQRGEKEEKSGSYWKPLSCIS
ncbi:unnamed protein product [Durusdinium trenchii]|uniref:Uncharacterized protein n=1 Tax=Durusdinium trenchii TaxID=1381693 RepID=A0ABP0QBV8_9DINO